MAEEEKIEEKQEEQAESQEIEFEIEDDMPEEDKAVLAKDKEKKEKPKKAKKSDDEDELDKYSEDVQKRINKLKREYHDERRAKESKDREMQEAIRYAEAVRKENEKLKKSLSKGESTLLEEAKARADMALEASKAQYRKAYEDGDADAMAEAQSKIADATLMRNKWADYDPQYKEEEKSKDTLQEPKDVYNQTNKVPEPDEKAKKWFSENKWFGQDDEMTAFSYGLHEKLVKSGIDPRSDEYYDKINERLRQVFPDRFENSEEDDSDLVETKTSKAKIAPSNVVAPVKRNPSSKKITLTATQVSMAKRLGVPLEEYAKQVAQLNR
tara:strand:+ start:361 stop:1338 length:978 start_codon:yes stop_codon:yes gene_type:complete